jgi:hypothetical protein
MIPLLGGVKTINIPTHEGNLMEGELLGLAGGGAGTLLNIAYTWWQTKQNTKDIEAVKADNKMLELSIDNHSEAFSNYRIHVAESYVPIGRFVDLEKKIDKIYEHILTLKP